MTKTALTFQLNSTTGLYEATVTATETFYLYADKASVGVLYFSERLEGTTEYSPAQQIFRGKTYSGAIDMVTSDITINVKVASDTPVTTAFYAIP